MKRSGLTNRFMENTNNRDIEKEDDLDLISIVKACWAVFRKQWKWFALSVAVCVAAGYFFQKTATQVFRRQSVMLIENAETGSDFQPRRASGRAMSSLLEMNGISVGDNLKNEIFILTSNRLMVNVVDSLGLDVDYATTHRMRHVPLYNSSPVRVRFRDKAEETVSFKLSILDNGRCRLAGFVTEDGSEAVPVEAKPGTSVATPAGVLTLEAAEGFADFPRGKELTVTHYSLREAAAIYQGKVSAAEYDKEASLIVLECKDADPQRATDLLDELVRAYKRDVVANKNRVAQSTMDFIDARARIIGTELSTVENEYADFKRRNKIVDLEQNAQQYLSETSDARRRIIDLETQLSVVKYLQDFVLDNSHAREVIPVLPGLKDASFSAPIAEYNDKMLKRNQFVENTRENADAVQELDRQLAALKKAIRSSLAAFVKSTELQLREARSIGSALSGQVVGIPEKEKYALDIKRQQELKSALYEYLLNKREEVAMQLSISEANVRVVEPPIGPDVPVSPRRSLIMLVSLLAGIAIPAAVFWLLHMFDVTVSGRKDIERYTTIPLVGEIPTWNGDANATVVTETKDASNAMVEAFRLLRYGLNFMHHNAKVIVVTSTTSGQGKSFISRNLSAVLGAASKRVLLVDADIRRRTQSSLFGKSAGLTSYLVSPDGETKLSDVVLRDAVAKGVDFLPAGITPPNPSELLMSERLETLIDEAGPVYDVIVFDTTPICSVADAGIVDRVADITLYVIRVGVEEKSFLSELEKMYQDNKYRHLCVVLNESDAKGEGAAYGYGYGYADRAEKRSKGRLRRLLTLKG